MLFRSKHSFPSSVRSSSSSQIETQASRPLPPSKWWRGEDSNLRRLSQQIYSLPPLTAREPLRKTVTLFSKKIWKLVKLLPIARDLNPERTGGLPTQPLRRWPSFVRGRDSSGFQSFAVAHAQFSRIIQLVLDHCSPPSPPPDVLAIRFLEKSGLRCILGEFGISRHHVK